jgi:Fibronectin type III domain
VTTPVQLTGTPGTSVTAGQNYLFQPAVAQGGGVVTFKIQGQPTWATFDTDTGALTGTPATANEGTTGSITITGTNGSSSASIGPFKIVIKAPATAPTTGSATLTWAPPTQNTDGTPITGLTGYHIYYGTSANGLTTTITVTDVSQTSYVVNGLAPGTYYFAVDAYNSANVDSAQSNVGSGTI